MTQTSNKRKSRDCTLRVRKAHRVNYPLKVAKGLLMIRRAVSARSGRATAHSETGPYRHQRYRYHQITGSRGLEPIRVAD
jgi:hypothetical protein